MSPITAVRGSSWRASAADAALARDDPAVRCVRAATHALAAVLFTFAGRDEDALRAVARAMPAVERAGGGVVSYTGLICRCCEALWRLGRADFADVLERNLLAKTLAGDFRELGVDARLAMAQLCALTGRPGEAHQWFERARAVLDEQGARPLRALVDLDEAWMEIRRGPHGDRDRARALLDVACEQFQAIGMPGWIERAEALRASLGGAAVEVAGGRRPAGPGERRRSGAREPRPGARRAPLRGRLLDRRLRRCRRPREGPEGPPLPRPPAAESRPGVPRPRPDRPGPGRRRRPGERDGAADGPLPLLDAEAKAAYRQRLGDLRAELAEAERCHDLGREEQAREEIEALTQQLAAAMGLGGRDRPAGSAAERARSTVSKRLRAVFHRIATRTPAWPTISRRACGRGRSALPARRAPGRVGLRAYCEAGQNSVRNLV